MKSPENFQNEMVKSAGNNNVVFSLLNDQFNFPFVVSCGSPDISISGWMKENRNLIDSKLKETGAILFRGFQVDTIEKFQSFMTYYGKDVLEYTLRSSPRHSVGEKVYVSTKYPSEYAINMHSESSYSPLHPGKIAFCCIEPSKEGGETPIADNRLVLKLISDKVKEKFSVLGVKYRRFFSEGTGMSWKEVFQTNEKQNVESECKKMGINFVWEDEADLILTWTKKAIWEHPDTGEKVWFNHALFFNQYAPGYEDMRIAIEHDRLPNNTFFGDGMEIREEEIQNILEAYQKSTTQFKWQKGDVLLLDNMLISHGRNPFKGSRNIIVSMA